MGHLGHGWGVDTCLTWEHVTMGPKGRRGKALTYKTHLLKCSGHLSGWAAGQSTKVWAFPEPAQEVTVRGGVGPGAMHWVLCIVWTSGAQRNPRAKKGRSRAGGTAQSALLGVEQSPVNHVQTRGEFPGSWSPHWWCTALPNLSHPLQLWPESVQAGGGGTSSLVGGGLVRAFTKYRSTCLQGAQGSELRPSLERGHRSENLQEGSREGQAGRCCLG